MGGDVWQKMRKGQADRSLEETLSSDEPLSRPSLPRLCAGTLLDILCHAGTRTDEVRFACYGRLLSHFTFEGVRLKELRHLH